MSFFPWSRPQPTPAPIANSDPALSTAAIVVIVVGVYLALVALVLVIRQCLKVSTRFFYNSYHLKQRHRPRFSFSYEVTRKYCRNVDLRELLFQINYYISGMWMEHWIFLSTFPPHPCPWKAKFVTGFVRILSLGR